MIEWILEKLPVIIFVVIFIGQMVRGLMKAKETEREAEPPVRHNELEEQRRTEEIQREIRRKIAERRGGAVPAEAPAAEPPPVMRRDPTAIPMPDPIGGPLRKLFEELERRAEPAAPPVAPPPVMAERRNEELERQQRLAAELEALKARRSAQATAKTETARQAGKSSAGGRALVEELRDPERLRRAFLQREILGPPVSLRP